MDHNLKSEEEEREKRFQDRYLLRQAEDKGFLVEDWYPLLSFFTAKTFFLDLSSEEATAVTSFYRHRFNKRKTLTSELVRTLRGLEERINQVLKKRLRESGAFIRLSTRSPKDGQPLNNKRIMENFENELQELKKKWQLKNWNLNLKEDEFEANMKMAAMFRGTDILLKCNSGSEAMSLLLSSERVFQDLNVALSCFKAKQERPELNFEWNMKISLREFNPKINGAMEFRCFVKDNIMTAISQYNHYIIVEDLLSAETCLKIKQKICHFWKDQIRTILEYLKDYIIDFAILSDDSVFIIELNPFLTTTGSALFDWTIDRDLLNGINIDKINYTEEKTFIRTRKEAYPSIVCLCEEFFIDEMKRMTVEAPYSELLDEIDPSYPNKSCSIC